MTILEIISNNNNYYYLTHCNTAQNSMVMVHSVFIVRSQQISCDIHEFVCQVKKWQKKIISSFSGIKLCFVNQSVEQ